MITIKRWDLGADTSSLLNEKSKWHMMCPIGNNQNKYRICSMNHAGLLVVGVFNITLKFFHKAHVRRYGILRIISCYSTQTLIKSNTCTAFSFQLYLCSPVITIRLRLWKGNIDCWMEDAEQTPRSPDWLTECAIHAFYSRAKCLVFIYFNSLLIEIRDTILQGVNGLRETH